MSAAAATSAVVLMGSTSVGALAATAHAASEPTSGVVNLLSGDQRDVESSAGGWAPQGNTTISRSAAAALTGTSSLRVVVDAAGPWPDGSRTARVGTTPGSAGVPAVAGRVYSGALSVRPDKRASRVRCEIRFYASNESILSTVPGPLVQQTLGGWSRPTCTATAPAGTARTGLRLYVDGASYGDVHYLDDAWLTQGGTPAPAPTAPTVPSPTTSPTPTTPTPTTPPAPTSPAPAPTTTPAPTVPAGTYPAPGTVGFRGDVSSLRVIDSARNAPSGARWTTGGLEVTADNLTLDGVYVKGGIDFSGRGTLTIRNSIIEGGHGAWFMVLGRTAGSTMDVRDSTLRWRAGSTIDAGSGTGALQIMASVRVVALRNDISGTADGIQAAGDGTRIEQNWIHDLALVGTYPNNTHNDGVQLYDGDNIVIAHNRIEIGFDGTHQNAALFFQPGGGNAIPGAQIYGNYLQGGGYTLRLEGATTGTIVRDNVFGPLGRGWGHAYAWFGATIGAWDRNVTTSGTMVGRPG